MSIYKEKIQQNPDVCSNCFRRNRDRFPINAVMNEGTVYPIRQSLQPIVSDKTYPRDSLESVNIDNGTAFACQCGVISPFTTIRPIDNSEMIDYAHRLRETLENGGVSMDHDTFYSTIRDLKNKPEEQGHDDRVFERATQRAVDHEMAQE